MTIKTPVLLVLSHGTANAGKSVEEAGALVCVTDKWDEKALEKGTSWLTLLSDAVSFPTILPCRDTRKTVQRNTSTCRGWQLEGHRVLHEQL